MRIFMIITLVISGALNLNGQINPMDHLFKDKAKDLIPYINPTLQYSQIVLQHSSIAGLGAGMIINKKITLGAVYNFAIRDIALPEGSSPGKFQMKWGGIHLEYTLWPLQKIHLTFPLSAGVGQLKITGNTNGPISGNPNFLFAEPGMMIEINVWKYTKLGIGTCYRYTDNVNYNSFTPDDLNGFAAVASIKFGIFRYLKRDLDKFNR